MGLLDDKLQTLRDEIKIIRTLQAYSASNSEEFIYLSKRIKKLLCDYKNKLRELAFEEKTSFALTTTSSTFDKDFSDNYKKYLNTNSELRYRTIDYVDIKKDLDREGVLKNV